MLTNLDLSLDETGRLVLRKLALEHKIALAPSVIEQARVDEEKQAGSKAREVQERQREAELVPLQRQRAMLERTLAEAQQELARTDGAAYVREKIRKCEEEKKALDERIANL
jgi:hypothetical protein